MFAEDPVICISEGILWRTLHIIYNFHIFILHTIHCCSEKDSFIYPGNLKGSDSQEWKYTKRWRISVSILSGFSWKKSNALQTVECTSPFVVSTSKMISICSLCHFFDAMWKLLPFLPHKIYLFIYLYIAGKSFAYVVHLGSLRYACIQTHSP
jgi:hypothetical protein